MGGSFDPVHLGHLIAAQDAVEQMSLDRVLFMPAAKSPLKRAVEYLPGEKRAALLRAAIAGHARFEISMLELDRGGTSLTIDTAKVLRGLFPGDQLFWIIGADQAAQIHDWRNIEILGGLVEFIVLPRPGIAASEMRAPAGLQLHRIKSHVFDISSSEVRERIVRGQPVRLFLPSAVADAIEDEALYRRPSAI